MADKNQPNKHTLQTCNFFACHIGGRCPIVANPQYRPAQPSAAGDEVEPEHWPNDFPELANIMERIEKDHDNGKAHVSSAYSVAPLVAYIARSNKAEYQRGQKELINKVQQASNADGRMLFTVGDLRGIAQLINPGDGK